jgi:hypothetical protein
MDLHTRPSLSTTFTKAMTTDASITLFISYAHNDEELRRQLDKHLAPLQRRKIIDAWHDRKIEAGQRWAKEIDEKLNNADIILLLISPDFVASNYCSEIELKKAMERHAAGESKVVPIILEPCDWKCYDFGQLQAFPKDGKAITLWPNRNEAFLNVAEGIGQVAEDLFEQRKKKLEEKVLAEQQYKTKVAEALSDGEISPLEQKTLDELRDTLGLTPEEAEEIKNKAYQPIKKYQEHLDKYKNDLNETIAAEYPLSERTKADLKQRQRDLGVKEEDAKKIEEPILAEAEARYRAHLEDSEAAKLRQEEKEYQDHLDKYKNDLNETIAAEYPLSERTKADLKQCQRDLGVLEDSEAAKLRQEEAGRSGPGSSSIGSKDSYQGKLDKYRTYLSKVYQETTSRVKRVVEQVEGTIQEEKPPPPGMKAPIPGGAISFCIHCGTVLRPGDVFCNGCGKRVVSL